MLKIAYKELNFSIANQSTILIRLTMRNVTILTLLFFISIFSKSFAIEVSSLDAEKKLEFSELFPKKICNKIYEESSFGKKNKLSEDVELNAYFNLKR